MPLLATVHSLKTANEAIHVYDGPDRHTHEVPNLDGQLVRFLDYVELRHLNGTLKASLSFDRGHSLFEADPKGLLGIPGRTSVGTCKVLLGVAPGVESRLQRPPEIVSNT